MQWMKILKKWRNISPKTNNFFPFPENTSPADKKIEQPRKGCSINVLQKIY